MPTFHSTLLTPLLTFLIEGTTLITLTYTTAFEWITLITTIAFGTTTCKMTRLTTFITLISTLIGVTSLDTHWWTFLLGTIWSQMTFFLTKITSKLLFLSVLLLLSLRLVFIRTVICKMTRFFADETNHSWWKIGCCWWFLCWYIFVFAALFWSILVLVASIGTIIRCMTWLIAYIADYGSAPS